MTLWNQTLFTLNSMHLYLVRMQHVVRMMDYAMQTTLKAAINYFKISTKCTECIILYGCGFARTHTQTYIRVQRSRFQRLPVCIHGQMNAQLLFISKCTKDDFVFGTTRIYPLKRYDHIESKELSILHYLNTKFMLENIYRLMYSVLTFQMVWACVWACICLLLHS